MMEKADFKDYAMEAALLEAQQKRQSHGSPGPNEPFPVQLHWMLEQAESAGISQIVRWSPHGRSFVVHRRDLFVEKVLPV
jgi:HSF-type DNA-binding